MPSMDEAGSAVWGSVHGQGYFWGEFGARHCNQWGLYGVRVLQRRDAALFPNFFGHAGLLLFDCAISAMYLCVPPISTIVPRRFR